MSGLHQVICTFDAEDVMGLLEFLEQTALSTFIRESSSLLAFPTFLCSDGTWFNTMCKCAKFINGLLVPGNRVSLTTACASGQRWKHKDTETQRYRGAIKRSY